MNHPIENPIEAINAVMMEVFEIPKEKLVPQSHLYQDLGLDSLDAIDLAMRFQTDFKIVLSNQEMQSIRTLGDVYKLAEEKSRS